VVGNFFAPGEFQTFPPKVPNNPDLGPSQFKIPLCSVTKKKRFKGKANPNGERKLKWFENRWVHKAKDPREIR